jgi:hypothetical protein
MCQIDPFIFPWSTKSVFLPDNRYNYDLAKISRTKKQTIETEMAENKAEFDHHRRRVCWASRRRRRWKPRKKMYFAPCFEDLSSWPGP